MRALFALLLLLCIPLAVARSPDDLVKAARTQIGVTTGYDPAYRKIAFPGGDVPPDRGVCTDVVIRAYRKLGIDLQALVHRDMRAAWSAYPKSWGLKSTDTNIDHRRVPNLAVFLRRHGSALPASRLAADYKAGDIVTWQIPPHLPHIGIVADELSANGTPLIIHNIGTGTQIEDILFAFKIVGHYRYFPTAAAPSS
jgi:uncharacterized protein YijF (DUF1287 family)